MIASHMLRQYRGLEVTVMEPGEPGGEFTAGGLKYLHRTDAIATMLSDLGMVFSNHSIRGGILLHDKVRAYPKMLGEVGRENATRIKYDHYRKTRRQEPGDFASKAMNDPEDVGLRRAVRCDFKAMIGALAERAVVVKARLHKIEPYFVITECANTHWYDYLILTIPLWAIKPTAYFHVPEGHAMQLNVAIVEPLFDSYAKWDYVYTPYTPADAIHRISSSDGVYNCEVNGELNRNDLVSDLNFIFKAGWAVESVREGLKGHLLPLSEQPEWPSNVAPLGRFAKWDPRSTADVVADDIVEIAENWGWQTI